MSFCTEKPEIIGIYGVSGGGKSSLAFHTIYALCAHSFSAIESGFVEDSAYIIDDYSNLIPALAIKQLNLNTNLHSTIYSYLNFSSALSSVGAIEYHFLKLNKPQNECPQCKGIGSAYKLDETKIIDVKARLEEIPILPFREYESLGLLFLEFCKYYQLDFHNTFETLSKQQQKLLLYVDESPLFTIKYRYNRKSTDKESKI